MPAITVGYPEFEARLTKVKRVLNRSALVDALCLAGATVLLSGATTTVARQLFAGAPLAWVQLGVYAAASTACFAVGWRLRANWLDLQATALRVDQQTGMHARLATMLAHPSQDAGSQLRTILLWEIFDLSTQWELPRIAPPRIRRPAVTLVIALVTFALARFLQPNPGRDPASAFAKSGVSTVTAADTEQPQPGQSASQRRGSEARTSVGNNHAQPGRRQIDSRERSDESADAGAGDASAARTGDRRGNTNNEHGQLDHAAPDDVTASGRRAGDPEEKDPSAAKTRESGQMNAGTSSERRALEAGLAPAEPQPGRTVASIPASAARRDGPTPTDPGKAGDKGGGSRTTARSTRDAERPAGGAVLGKEGTSPVLHNEKAEPMVIRLQAFAAGPARSEPQSGRERSSSASNDKRPEVTAEISASQDDDSVLRRSAVTRRHQALVRQLFTPDRE